MRSSANGIQGHQRVPTAMQIGKQLPQEHQELRQLHLRVPGQYPQRRVPLCQVHRGIGQVHLELFCISLGPCYLSHQPGTF
jgi:hypothetical protein